MATRLHPTIRTERRNGESYTQLKFPSQVAECSGRLSYNGGPLLDEDPYASFHPRSVSLECCDNEGEAGTDVIAFVPPMTTTMDFEEMKMMVPGHCIPFQPIPLYHSHVLWSYALRIILVEDGEFVWRLKSLGSHISINEFMRELNKKPDGPNNDPPGLAAPPLIEANLFLTDSFGRTMIKLAEFEPTPENPPRHPLAGEHSSKQCFTLEQLQALSVNGVLFMKLHISIARSYFSLASIIDLEKKPTVSEGIRRVVETIVRGEKPTGWDYMITGGRNGRNGDAPSWVYYVHREPFARTCPLLKEGWAKTGIPSDVNKRVVDTTLTPAGLKLAIHIAYGDEAPLSGPIDPMDLTALGGLFGNHFIEVVLPQWERVLCRKALAIDVRHPSSSSISELLRLLNIIWTSPYGSFPVAKRVVIGVLADTMHLNARPSLFQFVQDSVLPLVVDAGIKPVHLPSILTSLTRHLREVASVCKRGVVASSSGETKMQRKNEEKKEYEKERKKEKVKSEEKKEEQNVTLIDIESEDAVDVEAPTEGRRSCTIS